jgi:hypothetical protein
LNIQYSVRLGSIIALYVIYRKRRFKEAKRIQKKGRMGSPKKILVQILKCEKNLKAYENEPTKWPDPIYFWNTCIKKGQAKTTIFEAV